MGTNDGVSRFDLVMTKELLGNHHDLVILHISTEMVNVSSIVLSGKQPQRRLYHNSLALLIIVRNNKEAVGPSAAEVSK